jgi:hypothetical protein
MRCEKRRALRHVPCTTVGSAEHLLTSPPFA